MQNRFPTPTFISCSQFGVNEQLKDSRIMFKILIITIIK